MWLVSNPVAGDEGLLLKPRCQCLQLLLPEWEKCYLLWIAQMVAWVCKTS